MRYRDLVWFDDKLRWWGRRAMLGALLIILAVSMRACARAAWPATAAAAVPNWRQDFDARYDRMKAGRAPWQDTAAQLEAIRLGEGLKLAIRKYEAER